MELIETPTIKLFRSEDYNVRFNKVSGEMVRCGKTLADDPEYSKVGPELLDIEIVTDGCQGVGIVKDANGRVLDSSGPCRWCYKSNTNRPAKYMTLETYKGILAKLPSVPAIKFTLEDGTWIKVLSDYSITLSNGTVKAAKDIAIGDDIDVKCFMIWPKRLLITMIVTKIECDKIILVEQIAEGITGVQSNPDFIDILKYTREIGIVPNFTLSGFDLTVELAEQIVPLVGALAVSCYEGNKDLCYNTIELFSRLGLKQVNMHLLYHSDNEDFVHEVITDISSDTRLSGLNAVVLLGLKRKGRGAALQVVDSAAFARIVDHAAKSGINYGFDSCSTSKFSKWLDTTELYDSNAKLEIEQSVEPCESGLFSLYINVDGTAYPCSFAEFPENGIDVLNCNDFLQDVWFSPKMQTWRTNLLAKNRNCQLYPEVN